MKKQIKFKKNLILKRGLFIILLLMTLCIIFNFSAQNGETSGSLSKSVTEVIVKVISKIKTMETNEQLRWIEKLHPIIRKLAHFGLYTVVGGSAMGFMCTFDMKNIFKIIISFVTGLTYAISDEIHQYFIPGRSASILDVCIDSLGVLTGIFALITLIIFIEAIVNWFKRERKKH